MYLNNGFLLIPDGQMSESLQTSAANVKEYHERGIN